MNLSRAEDYLCFLDVNQTCDTQNVSKVVQSFPIMKRIDFSKFTDDEVLQKINECESNIRKLQISMEEEQQFRNQASMEYSKRMQAR